MPVFQFSFRIIPCACETEFCDGILFGGLFFLWRLMFKQRKEYFLGVVINCIIGESYSFKFRLNHLKFLSEIHPSEIY